MRNPPTLSILIVALAFIALSRAAAAQNPLPPIRPPAVPLVAHDPYFSVWSFNDKLNADWPHHWTGAINAMTAIIRIDGKPYVLMGNPRLPGVEPLRQQQVHVHPTRTIYTFAGAAPAGVDVTLTFLTPALPSDLDVLSRPVTYLTFDVRSNDNAAHGVQIYFDATAEWVVDKPEQAVAWDRPTLDGMTVLRIGSKDQPVLARRGDDLRIDWGHLLIAAPGKVPAVIASDEAARGNFARDGSLPAKDDDRMPRPARDQWPVLATVTEFGIVKQDVVSKHLMIAYDDDYSIEYMKEKLRPWWKRNGMTSEQLLTAADKDYEKLAKACVQFDEQLANDLFAAGGEKYARLCALAYRQCLAAHKLVASTDGKTPLLFSKENFSNGCIDTVDVTYPSAPFFLLFNPTLLKGQLTPILDYAAGDRWKFPFAPHDLGQYPKANGQVYGGGEKNERDQMPVEESGNMLIMLGALAKIEGNADYAGKYWPTLQKWAAYLKDKGLDPENQLCTDDFAGHLAHNTNLSLKAIVALAAYADLADRLGHKDEASTYRKEAAEMTAKWQTMAADGDHYKLIFDKAGTWSQKYNLVWDKLLGYNLFPKEVAAKEMAFYQTKLNKFGLPLDNRKTYTKLDWLVWTATMADNKKGFEAIIAPSYDWLSATPSRVPLTDWYDTVSGKQSGFQARSVVGGVFIKMLADEKMWKKYATAAGK
ncbi:MAG: glutaminase [Phycisphaerales bacterium]|nr:glutaminase [Phycisphaerales bacterium]